MTLLLNITSRGNINDGKITCNWDIASNDVGNGPMLSCTGEWLLIGLFVLLVLLVL